MNCEATITVLGKKYHALGNTPLEAIEKLYAPKVNTKAVLSVKNGDTTKERILMPATVARLFSASGFVREVAVKQVANMF